MKKITIFVSCVSSEFHHEDRHADPGFFSWRTELERELNGLERHDFVILTQESPAIAAAQGDMLEILQQAVLRSDYVVHLYGSLCGGRPQERSLRLLRERCGDFLAHEPEISRALPPWDQITFTQWELYFALAGRKTKPFIYLAEPQAPRSPLASSVPGDKEEIEKSSKNHIRVIIEAAGNKYQPIRNQDHWCRSVRSALTQQGVFNPPGLISGTAEAIKTAREAVVDLIDSIVRALGITPHKPGASLSAVSSKRELEIVESTAARAAIAPSDLLEIIDDHLDGMVELAARNPSAGLFSEIAFTCLALADYPRAADFARQAADHALKRMEAEPAFSEELRQEVLNALFLVHDASRLARDVPRAIATLEEAGALIDRESEPLLWVEVFEPLVQFLINHAQYARAEELLNEVIDIREEREQEDPAALAHTLLLWGRLLNDQTKFQSAIDVAKRASVLFTNLTPPDLVGFASALTQIAAAMEYLGRSKDAESMHRRALDVREEALGKNHPDVAQSLSNLASLVSKAGRLDEAEQLHRRALHIREQTFGINHPEVTHSLNNLGCLLCDRGCFNEAEELHRRVLEICEKSLSPDHPQIAYSLNNLGCSLFSRGCLNEAEESFQRALDICLRTLVRTHPLAKTSVDNLVNVFHKKADQLRQTGSHNEADYWVAHARTFRSQILGDSY